MLDVELTRAQATLRDSGGREMIRGLPELKYSQGAPRWWSGCPSWCAGPLNPHCMRPARSPAATCRLVAHANDSPQSWPEDALHCCSIAAVDVCSRHQGLPHNLGRKLLILNLRKRAAALEPMALAASQVTWIQHCICRWPAVASPHAREIAIG